MDVSAVDAVADRFVSNYAALDPCPATEIGMPEHDGELTDFSPAGIGARADLTRSALAEFADDEVSTDRDRLARAVVADRLETELVL